MRFAIAELRAFVAIARHQSFSRAASELHISQPALTRRIQLMEGSLGASLFNRYLNGTQLTEAGRAFLPHAKEALSRLDVGAEAVRSTVSGDHGEIHFGIAHSLCNVRALNALNKFRASNPGAKLVLRSAPSAKISEMVLSGEVSIALRYRLDRDRRITGKVLWHEKLALVASPNHPFANRKSISIAELEKETWIVRPLRPSEPDGGIASTLHQYGLKDAPTVVIDNSLAQKRLVQENFGIGVIAFGSVQEEVASGKLCVLQVPSIKTEVPVVLIHRKNMLVGRLADRLMKTLAHVSTPTAKIK